MPADALVELKVATEKRLSGEIDWQAQVAEVSGAQARAKAAEDKAQRSESDRDEKSKPYLADPFFIYLWRAGYGTPAYRGGSIARLGDGFVARVVNYEPARQNYFTLTEIPQRLREHADRLKADVEGAEAELIALERRALEADGIVRLEEVHKTAEGELADVDQRTAEFEQEDVTLEHARESLLGEGELHGLARVLEDLAASMQRED